MTMVVSETLNIRKRLFIVVLQNCPWGSVMIQSRLI